MTRYLSCILCFTFCGTFVLADDDRNQKAFAWFDERGFPSRTDAPLVRILTKYPNGYSSKGEFTFLLDSDDTSFECFDLDLYTRTRKRESANSNSKDVYERVDLAKHVDAMIDLANHQRQSRLGKMSSPAVEIFLFTRACDA